MARSRSFLLRTTASPWTAQRFGINRIGSLSPLAVLYCKWPERDRDRLHAFSAHTDGLIGLAATLLKLLIGKDRGRQPHIRSPPGRAIGSDGAFNRIFATVGLYL
jgi:hypothetical protein